MPTLPESDTELTMRVVATVRAAMFDDYAGLSALIGDGAVPSHVLHLVRGLGDLCAVLAVDSTGSEEAADERLREMLASLLGELSERQ